MTTSAQYSARLFSTEGPDPDLYVGTPPRVLACEAGDALAYAFRGDRSPMRPALTSEPCDEDRHAVLLYHSASLRPGAELGWKVFRVCGPHLRQLLRLDAELCREGWVQRPRAHRVPSPGSTPLATELMAP